MEYRRKLIITIALIVIAIITGFLALQGYCTKQVQTQNHRLREDIISFFRQNPYPSDQLVHKYAIQKGINKHLFEEHIYALLTDLLREKNFYSHKIRDIDI